MHQGKKSVFIIFGLPLIFKLFGFATMEAFIKHVHIVSIGHYKKQQDLLTC